jgi:hypothetical protein
LGIIIAFIIAAALSSLFFVGGFNAFSIIATAIYLGVLIILFIGLVYPVYRLSFFMIFEKNYDALKALKESYEIFMKKLIPISIYLTYIYAIELLLNVLVFGVIGFLIWKIYPNFTSDISNFLHSFSTSASTTDTSAIINAIQAIFGKFALILAAVYLMTNLLSLITPLIWASTYIKYFDAKKYDFEIPTKEI